MNEKEQSILRAIIGLLKIGSEDLYNLSQKIKTLSFDGANVPSFGHEYLDETKVITPEGNVIDRSKFL